MTGSKQEDKKSNKWQSFYVNLCISNSCKLYGINNKKIKKMIKKVELNSFFRRRKSTLGHIIRLAIRDYRY